MNSRVCIENDLADALLKEVIFNPQVKAVLNHIAQNAIKHILKPFLAITLAQGNLAFNEYPPNLQKALNYLVEKHLKSEVQFGGLLTTSEHKELVTQSLTNLTYLFTLIETRLLNIYDAQTRQDFLSIIKCLSDLGRCYFECLPELHQENYDAIKNMIWPTPEEFFDARIRRDELSSEKVLARTAGIGTVFNKDLLPAQHGLGWDAGKSIFAGVSMQQRFELLTKRFDQTLAELNYLRKQRELDPTERWTDTDLKIQQLQAKLLPLQNKLQYYRIPLDSNSRLSLSHYAQQYKTTFEKLAELPVKNHKEPLPMIASVSGSMARNLVAFQDIGVFLNTQDEYNFDRIQLLNNCFAAYYIFCGHHSFLEVAEVHNRLLDYIAIYDKEKIPATVFQTPDKSEDNNNWLETRLPYYHIGDYRSFIHENLASNIEPQLVHSNTFKM